MLQSPLPGIIDTNPTKGGFDKGSTLKTVFKALLFCHKHVSWQNCHNGRTQIILIQQLLSTSLLLEIPTKVMRMSHPFSEIFLDNNMLINDRHSQTLLQRPFFSSMHME